MQEKSKMPKTAKTPKMYYRPKYKSPVLPLMKCIPSKGLCKPQLKLVKFCEHKHNPINNG